MLVLEPVVEFAPWDWIGEEAHELIQKENWKKYWDTYLQTLGVKPTHSGSWFVSVNEINHSKTLEKLIKLYLKPDKFSIKELQSDAIRFSAFIGGYMLFKDEKILFEPQCCCDLGDLYEWKKVGEIDTAEWYNVLIGHALMYVRKVNNQIEIKEKFEYGNKEPILELVDIDELVLATSKAEKSIFTFKEKLIPVIDDIVGNHTLTKRLSGILVGRE